MDAEAPSLVGALEAGVLRNTRFAVVITIDCALICLAPSSDRSGCTRLKVMADSSSRRPSCASPNVATPDGSCDHGDNARVGFWLFLLWAVGPPSRSAGKAISTSDSLASSKLIRADGQHCNLV